MRLRRYNSVASSSININCLYQKYPNLESLDLFLIFEQIYEFQSLMKFPKLKNLNLILSLSYESGFINNLSDLTIVQLKDIIETLHGFSPRLIELSLFHPIFTYKWFNCLMSNILFEQLQSIELSVLLMNTNHKVKTIMFLIASSCPNLIQLVLEINYYEEEINTFLDHFAVELQSNRIELETSAQFSNVWHHIALDEFPVFLHLKTMSLSNIPLLSSVFKTTINLRSLKNMFLVNCFNGVLQDVHYSLHHSYLDVHYLTELVRNLNILEDLEEIRFHRLLAANENQLDEFLLEVHELCNNMNRLKTVLLFFSAPSFCYDAIHNLDNHHHHVNSTEPVKLIFNNASVSLFCSHIPPYRSKDIPLKTSI
jgi:hypothetical protein